MMNKQTFTPYWGHLREMNGIAMRLVELIPEDKLDARPIKNMRSVKELLVHMYGTMVKEIGVGIGSGTIGEPDEHALAKNIKTKQDALRFCKDCWSAADKAASMLTDSQLAAKVKTPWGFDMEGWMCASTLQEEFAHHRGQLFCYVRALGAKEVPMLWDFEHNAPEYRAEVTATV